MHFPTLLQCPEISQGIYSKCSKSICSSGFNIEIEYWNSKKIKMLKFIFRPLLENRRGSIPTSKLPKNPISPEEWFEKENSFQQLPKGIKILFNDKKNLSLIGNLQVKNPFLKLRTKS
jgi:hypothetical protein